MVGTLLYINRTDGGWGGTFPLQLLLTDGDSPTFKKSYLWRPSDKLVYGDKEVSHRKMEGAVEANFKSPLYYTPGSNSYQFHWKYSVYVDMEYAMSSSKAYAYGYSHGYGYFGYEEMHVQYELFTRPNDLDPSQTDIIMARKLWEVWQDEPDWEYRTYGWFKNGDIHHIYLNPWDSGGMIVNTSFEYDLTNPLPWYWIDYMDDIRPYSESDYTIISELIRNEIQSQTTFDTNNYANLLEVIDSINDFRKGKLVDLVEDSREYVNLVRNTFGHTFNGRTARTLAKKTSKGVADGWLKYRYMYNTTKADVEQYVEAKLGEYLGTVDEDRVFRTAGRISDGTVHLKFRIRDNQQPNFDKLLISMNQYGLFPGLYNVWDLIPFSFIADWTSNLGEYLQDIDQSIFFRYYEILELLVSRKQILTKDEPWGSTTYTWYDRELWDTWPSWEIYDDQTTSGKTMFYRALDSLSLIVGVS